jgi:hypothetical protein
VLDLQPQIEGQTESVLRVGSRSRSRNRRNATYVSRISYLWEFEYLFSNLCKEC